MKTKFKLGDFVKHDVYDETGNYCRTIKGQVVEITIKKYGTIYKLDTEKKHWF